MPYEVERSALSYPSKDGSTTIRARLWAPAAPDGAPVAPRAIVQIVHGMCEHMGRYDEFARFLAGNGFAVCGEDNYAAQKVVARNSGVFENKMYDEKEKAYVNRFWTDLRPSMT